MYETVRGHGIRVLTQIESIANAYVYATRLPDFRAIVLNKGKVGAVAGSRVKH